VITLTVPGALMYRDVAVRVVGAACKLLGPAGGDRASSPDLGEEFASQVVSAFGEAFNNLALHGYKGVADGRIDIEVTSIVDGDGEGELTIRIRDTGRVFDPREYLELPDVEPERGMGLFIIRNFIDEIAYEKGPPNVLQLKKRFVRGG
jgi:serine/threonine-protein kinase RsbW